MTRYLTIGELLSLYRCIMDNAGQRGAIQKLDAIQVHLARPKARWRARELIPTLSGKAASLCYSLLVSHGFVEGNQRIAHAALETMLVLNGCEIAASLDEQERVMLAVAEESMIERELVEWVDSRLIRCSAPGATSR